MPDPIIQRIEVTAPDWGFTMNAYVVRDPETGATAIVDPGAEPERIRAAAGGRVEGIWITHRDFDHVGAVEAVRASTQAPIIVGRADAEAVPRGSFVLVDGGETLALGNQSVRVFCVPGHTPGHVAFLAGKHLLGGDILFPGGPGHTDTPEAFRQLIAGIEGQLFTLDDDVVVHPGHGEPTTIGAAKEEYAAFRQRTDIEGLYGDVTWSPPVTD